MTVHPFPERITRLTMWEQKQILKTTTTGEVLAAIAAKYPALALTADEIQ